MTTEAAPSATLALQTIANQSADPHFQGGWALSPLVFACFEQLSRWGPEGDLVPALAESIEEPPDHRSLIFRLRRDATFWDGSPVTSEDVKWSYERYVSLPVGDSFQPILERYVHSVETPDPHTVVVNLSAPHVRRLSWGPITPRGWSIASRAHFHRNSGAPMHEQLMGTGPFRIVRNEPGAVAELEAYPGHYERPPRLRHLRLKSVPSESDRVERLRSGEADFADALGAASSAALDGSAATLQPWTIEATTCPVLFFQEPDLPPFNDVRVRRALNLLVDQPRLVREVLGGNGAPSAGAPLFPITYGFDPARFPAARYDPAEARALLEAAGVAGGLRVSVGYYDSRQGTGTATLIPALVQAVAGMWKSAGIEVVEELPEWYLARYRAHQLHGVAALGTAACPFPDYLLAVYFRPGDPDGYGNYGVPTTPAIVRKIDALCAEFDPAAHAALAAAIYTDVIDESWCIALPWIHSRFATRRDRISSWQPLPGQRLAAALETLTPLG